MNSLSNDVIVYSLIPFLTDFDLFGKLVLLSKRFNQYKQSRSQITETVNIHLIPFLTDLKFRSVLIPFVYDNDTPTERVGPLYFKSYDLIPEDVTTLTIDFCLSNKPLCQRFIARMPSHIQHLKILNHRNRKIFPHFGCAKHIKTLEILDDDFPIFDHSRTEWKLNKLIVQNFKLTDNRTHSFVAAYSIKELIVRGCIDNYYVHISRLRDMIMYADRLTDSRCVISRHTHQSILEVKELHLNHWDQTILPPHQLRQTKLYVQGKLYEGNQT